ncbi:MAG: cbb3-type cytochrome c oxidase subunit II [Acidobacteriaceae bacterium]
MSQLESRWSGWRGVGLVALTYVYFLIFAQFAFLKRLADLDIAGAHLKAVMAAMAIGGILFSLLTPRLALFPSPQLRLRMGLLGCGAAALLTLLPLGLAGSIAVSFLIGAGLGLLTVTLVTHLRLWLGSQNPLLKVGLGTGLGYLICNIPLFFTASPELQAGTSAMLCLAGIGITLGQSNTPLAEPTGTPAARVSFLRVLACFTALVWLDSAAFFIIQNTPALKAGTWAGTAHLWTDGLLHLTAALASAWFLRRRGLSFTLSLAFGALAFACLLLLDPHRILLASVFYPIGVSLYSVALVAYPSLLAPVSSAAERGRQAGWIYAIAGWFGSAMGIGMGQNLGHVPAAFVFFAGALILLPEWFGFLRQRKREVAVTVATLVVTFSLHRAIVVVQAPRPVLSQVQRGRQVYISEGCISCHSQYVRPNTSDVLMWGPAEPLGVLREEHPPLIGNRREGPDLAEVGSRRSALWLKAHLEDPAELSYRSFMPSYRYLFQDHRGDDLVAYLQSLQGGAVKQHLAAERAWHPSPEVVAAANAGKGAQLFRHFCATCHASDGSTRRDWQTSFKKLPPDLTVGPFSYLPVSGSNVELRDRLAQIVKFGIPGTDMPGHEYLHADDITSISLWVAQNIARPVRKQ